ncbi:HAMP domain-containing histidine kinase [bacterium]|nr:HAMP domain-containing histidine kinase [bacterium]
MKYETKLALQIFTLGTIILAIGLFTAYRYNSRAILQHELNHTELVVDAVSGNFEQLLLEKVKTNQTLSITPIINNALITSNCTFGNLSEKERNEKIYLQNEQWKATEDEKDAFILEFTHNSVAQFLKEQQNNLKGEYGEIFLTNKYGALVASTAKLTTFAHAHKYWWKGAYNNGLGAVFLDDRGYDNSVDGYVLGVVIPIKEENKIIGMLKVNLNILGAISEMILNSQNETAGDFKLIRSGGEIVFERESAPLSTRIPNLLYKKLQSIDEHSFQYDDSDNKWLIGNSEVGITSKDAEGYLFGGSFESVDHKKGNTGESWHIINSRNLATILEPLKDSTLIILAVGFLLIIILAIVAFIFGKLAVNPLKQLIEQSKKIAKTDFSARIVVSRKDEIGLLGKAFNKMAEELEKTTTSLKKLESSEQKILQQNKKLQDLNATKDKFFSIIAHDLKSPYSSMLGFSGILYNEFDDYDTQEQKQFIKIIHSELQNAFKLLENLLYWSHSQMNTIDFYPEKENLFLISQETIGMLRLSAINKSISLINEIPKHIFVKTDKNMFAVILRNLVSNAIKFTPKQGTVEVAACTITNKNNQEYAEITIKDNGVGVLGEIQSKLFDISESTSTRGTENEAGSGLGLILCKEFIEKHNGKIWIENEMEKGSKFIFTIPIGS